MSKLGVQEKLHVHTGRAQLSAKCKMETCPVTVKLAIKSASDNNVTEVYVEDPKHDIKEIQSQRITGTARKSLATRKFANNPRSQKNRRNGAMAILQQKQNWCG